jgi:hypothetical protein
MRYCFLPNLNGIQYVALPDRKNFQTDLLVIGWFHLIVIFGSHNFVCNVGLSFNASSIIHLSDAK